MLRRTALRRGGSIVAGAVTLGGTVVAKGSGEKPSGNVSTTDVHPFSTESDPIEVPAGDWIRYEFGWIDTEEGSGDSTREDIVRWLDTVDFDFWIDGEPIPNAEQYYSEPFQNDDGTWLTRWEYFTPPETPGDHVARFRWTYTRDFDDGTFHVPEGHVVTMHGYYEVVPGGGSR